MRIGTEPALETLGNFYNNISFEWASDECPTSVSVLSQKKISVSVSISFEQK